MANQGFIKNKHLDHHLKAIWLASLNLSLGDYQILDVSSKQKDELPRIKIDRKLEGDYEYKQHQLSERIIEYCISWGVVIYWHTV